MPYTVYTMTNNDDTHIYVGSTKNFERRRYMHMNNCKNGTHPNQHVQALYNQLGPDGFEFDAVEEFDTKAEARDAEQLWVDYYLAAPEWQLLNIATNDVNQASKNPEVAAKIAAANTGKVRSVTTKTKISEAHKKPVHVKWADGTEAEFESINAAAAQVGVSHSHLCNWIAGRRGGYTRYGIVSIEHL